MQHHRPPTAEHSEKGPKNAVPGSSRIHRVWSTGVSDGSIPKVARVCENSTDHSVLLPSAERDVSG